MDLMLTPLEARIAALAGQGLPLRDVADQLGLTHDTVKVYLSKRVYPKCGVRNQAGLIRLFVTQVEQRGDCSKCCLRQAMLLGAPTTGPT